MRLAYALTATNMRMRENDVTLGIPKSSCSEGSQVKFPNDIPFLSLKMFFV